MSEKNKAAATLAVKNLKKVVASSGALQGNFYFAGDTKGKAAGLIVTLTARDKKGAKAASQGKALRKELKATKFARGTVSLKKGKLFFAISGGNASKSHMVAGFKKAFEFDEAKPLKALLKKSRVGVLKEDGTPDESSKASEEIDDTEEGLSSEDFASVFEDVEEEESLEKLLKEQGRLSESNQKLSASFLSAEEEQQETEELVEDLIKQIKDLEGSDSPDQSAITAARCALAEAMYTGPDPFPEEATELPKDVEDIFKASSDRLELLSYLRIWSKAVKSYEKAISTVDGQLSALRAELMSRDDENYTLIAISGLDSIIDGSRTAMLTAIGRIESAKVDQKAAAFQSAGDRIDAFVSHLDTSTQVQVVDDNPFGKPVALAATLKPALALLKDAIPPS